LRDEKIIEKLAEKKTQTTKKPVRDFIELQHVTFVAASVGAPIKSADSQQNVKRLKT
jgi:hypothetical protein